MAKNTRLKIGDKIQVILTDRESTEFAIRKLEGSFGVVTKVYKKIHNQSSILYDVLLENTDSVGRLQVSPDWRTTGLAHGRRLL